MKVLKANYQDAKKKTFNGVSCYVDVLSVNIHILTLENIFNEFFRDAELLLYTEKNVRECDRVFDVVIEYKNSADTLYSRDKVKIYDILNNNDAEKYPKCGEVYDCVNVYLMLKGEDSNLFSDKQDKGKKGGKCCCC